MLAYLDPGTGGLLIQAVLGGIAGLAVFFKTIGKNLRFWRRSPAEQPTVEHPPNR